MAGTYSTLQHFRNDRALEPLYKSLDELQLRVQGSHSLNNKDGYPAAQQAQAGPRTTAGKNLEQQLLPQLADGAQFPCFEHAHDWEALQAEVNDASRHFNKPTAKVAWKKWALGPANVQVVVAVAWWVVAHVFQPLSPGSSQLQSCVLQAFSRCYAHTVLQARKESYITLWLEVVAAAAVRLLREAFPHQHNSLHQDLQRLVKAQLVRWTSGLLPSDLHPSLEAPSSAPAPAPASAPPSPCPANASSWAPKPCHTPTPNASSRLTPVPGLQPAAVTLYQRHLEQGRAEQQDLELHQARSAARAAHGGAADPAWPAPPQRPAQDAAGATAAQWAAHAGSPPSREGLLAAVASGAVRPPTCQWLSECMGPGPLQGLHPWATSEAAPATWPRAGVAAGGVAGQLREASAAAEPGGLAGHFQPEGGGAAVSTYRLGPTARRKRSRRPTTGLQPQQGVYHPHYQAHRRHQHPEQEPRSTALRPAGEVPPSQQQQEAMQEQVLLQQQQQQQQRPGEVQGMTDSATCGRHAPGQLEEQQSFPTVILTRSGFPTRQMSPAMTLLMEAQAVGTGHGGPPITSPPLLTSGVRHEKLGTGLPALRQPLQRGGTSLLRQWHECEEGIDGQLLQQTVGGQRSKGRVPVTWEGCEDGPQADLQDMQSYAKMAARESTQRAADAVAKYEAYRKASRREVASIQREWKACRDNLTIQQQSEVVHEVLADKLSGWIESWGDAGRILKGKPQATTRVTHQQQDAGRAAKAPRGPSSRALPATCTDAVLWSKGGASVGAAVGVRSTGVPFGGGATAANLPGYTQMTEAAVAGVRQAGTSILAACAATARSAPPSTTRIMQPWSRMRAVQARAQRALDPARHNAADVAAHVAAIEQCDLAASTKASKQAQWRPQSRATHKRGTLDACIHVQARKVMHSVDMGLYES